MAARVYDSAGDTAMLDGDVLGGGQLHPVHHRSFRVRFVSTFQASVDVSHHAKWVSDAVREQREPYEQLKDAERKNISTSRSTLLTSKGKDFGVRAPSRMQGYSRSILSNH